jgi:hypothetical protein
MRPLICVQRRLYVGSRLKLELMAEFFIMFNRNNRRADITDDAFIHTAGSLCKSISALEIDIFRRRIRTPQSSCRRPMRDRFNALRLVF